MSLLIALLIASTLLSMFSLLVTLSKVHMSESYNKLSSLVASAVSKISELSAQVAGLKDELAKANTEKGTKDSDLDTLSDQLSAALTPAVPPAEAPAA